MQTPSNIKRLAGIVGAQLAALEAERIVIYEDLNELIDRGLYADLKSYQAWDLRRAQNHGALLALSSVAGHLDGMLMIENIESKYELAAQ
jgi:hypothetical protein